MNIIYRNAVPADCPALGELDRIASGGVLDFLYRDLAAGRAASRFSYGAGGEKTVPQ